MFNFTKNLQACHFVVGGLKSFKLLSVISFDSGCQKIVLSNLPLFSCACYKDARDNIQQNEVATSTARNFSNRYLHFSRIITLCPNIWFAKNSECQQFLFWRKSRQKNKFFFKEPLFCNGSLYWCECWLFWETFVGFLKNVAPQLFPKYSQKLC